MVVGDGGPSARGHWLYIHEHMYILQRTNVCLWVAAAANLPFNVPNKLFNGILRQLLPTPIVYNHISRLVLVRLETTILLLPPVICIFFHFHIADYKKRRFICNSYNLGILFKKRLTKEKLKDVDKIILLPCNACYALKCFTRYKYVHKKGQSLF